jgi:hypothetical protein
MKTEKRTVTSHLKTGIVQPEETVVTSEWLDKHMSVAIEELLETVCPMRSITRLYNEGH